MRAAWTQLAIFVIGVIGALVVHQSGSGEFRLLVMIVSGGFLVIGAATLIWLAWRNRKLH